MNKGRVAALVGAALVAGMVLGSFGIASAAVDTTSTAGTGSGAGLGLRLGRVMKDAGATLADVVAKLTGMSVDEVGEQRVEGKSFSEIAESKGVSSDKVLEGTLAARERLLDAKVADGTITREQADGALARMKSRLEGRIDSTQQGGCGAGGGRGGGRGFGGCGGGGCGSAANSAY